MAPNVVKKLPEGINGIKENIKYSSPDKTYKFLLFWKLFIAIEITDKIKIIKNIYPNKPVSDKISKCI